MKHVTFGSGQATSFENAVLVKTKNFKKNSIDNHYVGPLVDQGVDVESLIAMDLPYDDKGKAPVKFITAVLSKLLPALNSLGVERLLVTDSAYFKKLTGVKKTDTAHGYVKPVVIKGFEHMEAVLSVNYAALFHNPKNQPKIDMSIQTFADCISGNVTELGADIIHGAMYCHDYLSAKALLTDLLDEPVITCDVETFGLKHYEAGLATIAFSVDEHHGGAIAVEHKTVNGENINISNPLVQQALVDFFEEYEGKLVFHNAVFDIKILIYYLFMSHLTDLVGMYRGIEVMTRSFDCTKTIAYLATNSCAGNELGLKALSHEFAGDYAQTDIADVLKIISKDLLKYNLVDCLSTYYVFNKYLPMMVEEDQEGIYDELFKPSVITIIAMELTGLPIIPEKVQLLKQRLEKKCNEARKKLKCNYVSLASIAIAKKAREKDYQNRKAKAKNPEKIVRKPEESFLTDYMLKSPFNPNSGQQVATLLHDIMKLPVLDTTKTGQPATDDDTLKALLNHTTNDDMKDVIEALRDLGKAGKILTSFVPAFEQAQLGTDGIHYLFGSFNLGGTVSGRLSSSNPNLQNIPSGSTYSAWVKECFAGNDEWVFCGADFASLEDYVSALTTKDPAKLKVYIDGYDGHCLRAYSYFGDQMLDIEDTVDSINSIKSKYPKLRKRSKGPTFLLTYQGTYIGLMKNLGFEETEAKRIEANYHTLYNHSDEWVAEKLKQASKDGFVRGAFGLKVRTPLISKTVLGTSYTPYKAEKEGRTAGNALGQSYCLLNSRAANEFFERLMKSKYKYDVKICAQIHDAIYLMVRNDVEVMQWVNKNLTECMAWQEAPELQHDIVKIHAELDLFPDWNSPITLQPDWTQDQILEACLAGPQERE